MITEIKFIPYKGKGEHSVNELELIVEQREEQIRFINSSKTLQNNDAVKLLRDLAEFQNGAPLVQHEKEYNETMDAVWDFLDKNETTNT